MQRLKAELAKTQKALAKLQKDGRDAAKVERKLKELQDEQSARSTLKELCSR